MQRKEMHPLTGAAIEMQKETPAIAAIWYSYLSFSPRATSVHILYAKCAKANYNNINGGKKREKLQWQATTMRTTKVKPHAFIHLVYSFSCSSFFLPLQHFPLANDNGRLHLAKKCDFTLFKFNCYENR